MGEVLIPDLETDGLLYPRDGSPPVRNIWMIGILNFDTDVFDSYSGYEHGPLSIMAGIQRMLDADLLIGHNLLGYDLMVIEQFTDGGVRFDRARVIDTLPLSRRLVNMPRHRLEDWGEIFDYPKLPSPDFKAGYTPEMMRYCERDCRLNKKLFETLVELQDAPALLLG